MIDELLELTSHFEDFERLIISPIKTELGKLEQHQAFLEPKQEERRVTLTDRLELCKNLEISIKTCQEIAVINRLMIEELKEGVKKYVLTDKNGEFRKTLLQPQTEFLTEYLKKINNL